MNNQPKPLTLSSVTVSGEGYAVVDYPPYLGAAPCSTNIPANSGCPIWVQFSPRQAGPRSGVLTITGDGPGGPRTVQLAGLSLANFQLSYDPPPPVSNGTDSVQFIVRVNSRPYGPSAVGSVALSCTGAAVSCRFNPPQVAADAPTPWSTLTVTGLSGFRGDVLPFAVTGTLNGQTDSLPVTLSFYGLQLQNVVSAASYLSAYAPESIATAFGSHLAIGSQSALANPLPTNLQGTTVTVEGGNNVARVAPLFFVSPGQVNFQIPPATYPGLSRVSVASADGTVSYQYVVVTAVAPALFSANASGQGPAAALAFHVKPGGTQTYELLAVPGSNGALVASPIDLGPAAEQVYLSLYGTGLRGRSSLAAVTAAVGGIAVPVVFAGLQGQYAGLDQVNVGPLPRSLAGHGLINITITVDGTNSNTVQMLVR